MHWRKFKDSHLVCQLSHLSLLWIAVSMCPGPCSTMNESSGNGYDHGCYEPECQIENLAFRKPASQSSTYGIYTADYAVNGIIPSLGDWTENNCSHTEQSEPNAIHWWYVTLSSSEDFVLKNVTIVARQFDPQGNPPPVQSFYILYTRNNTGDPNLTTWQVCTSGSKLQTNVETPYMCVKTAIGRRIAIYLDERSVQYKRLTLCEVYVYGYPYTDSVISRDLLIFRASTGDKMAVEITKMPAVPFNFLVVLMNSTDDEDRTYIVPVAATNRSFSVTIDVIINQTYAVSVVPETCCFETTCLTYDTNTSNTDHSKCVMGHPTQPVIIDGYRERPVNAGNSEVIAGATGGAISLIVLMAMAAVLVLQKQRRTAKSTKKNPKKEAAIGKTNQTHINDVYCDEEDPTYAHTLGTDQDPTYAHTLGIDQNPTYATTLGMDQDPTYANTLGMDLAEFEHYSKNESSILDKFRELRVNGGQLHEIGLSHEKKNRFKDTIPYDINRVILQCGNHDYINASYINGFNRKQKYIATQGPTSATTSDFWNMIWQENSAVIVMLTPHVEENTQKCEQYFPIKDARKYGILVDVKSDTVFDSHKVSVLNLKLREEIKTVHHLHFLVWPEGSVPEHSGDLIMFLAKVRKTVYNQHFQRGPIVVHCSAGVGHTGAYIALDYMLDRYLAERRVDVDSCVVALRDQRMHMVQTKEQYAFIHKALLYGMKTLSFVRDMEDLNNLSENCGTHNDYRLAAEWKCLQMASDGPTYSCSHYTTALLPENISKNRHTEILASDEKRPILGGLNGSSQSYINAVFCNGCYAKNAFVATQWPMNETISDFWELVHESRSGCIILLHRSPSPQEYPAFFPLPGTSISAGAFKVKSLSSSKDQESGVNEQVLFVSIIANIIGPKPSPLTVRLVELELFALDSQVPSDIQQTARSILYLNPEFKQSSYERPTIVVCKDGASFCGLFLAAANSLHRMIESGYVQVFHTVDLLRASRAQFVNTPAQYNYLYQLLKYYNGTKCAADNT